MGHDKNEVLLNYVHFQLPVESLLTNKVNTNSEEYKRTYN